jgi:hypothetical protein
MTPIKRRNCDAVGIATIGVVELKLEVDQCVRR